MNHYLRPNHGERMPSLVVSADVATLPLPHPHRRQSRLECWQWGHVRWCRLDRGRPTRRGERACATAAELWELVEALTSRARVVWLFAYQLNRLITASRWWERKEAGLWSFTDPRDKGRRRPDGSWQPPRTGMLVTEDPPAVVQAWCIATNGLMTAIDLRNYHSAPLAEIAARHEIALPAARPMGQELAESADLVAWQTRAIEAAALELVRWVRAEKLGNFRPTIASQALASWKHRFMPPGIVCHEDLEAKRWERVGLYGARQLVHWIGRIVPPGDDWFGQVKRPGLGGVRAGPVYCLDVRAHYPSVMASQLYPRERVRVDTWCSLPELERRLGALGAMAEVEIDGNDEPWPWRRSPSGRVWWCVGRFWTVLCGPELVRAVKGGWVRAVGRVHWYSLTDLFSGYVRYWWEARLQAMARGDALGEDLAKWMANSLHGKLGQRSYGWTTEANQLAAHPWGTYHTPGATPGEITCYRGVGWDRQRQLARDETPEGMPIVTAWVHAHAREMMRRLHAVATPAETLWEDCDSLLVTQAGYDHLRAAAGLLGDGLGQLRLDWSAQAGTIRGLHNYQLDGRTILCGLAKEAVPLSEDEWVQEELQHMEGTIRRRPPKGQMVSTEHKVTPGAWLPGKVGRGGLVTPYTPEEVPHET